MSEENVERVRRSFEAFAKGGPDALVEFWDPEITLWLRSGLVESGTYRGKEAVLAWMREWAEAWEEINYTPEEFIDGDDSVIACVLYDGRGKGSAVNVEGRFWFVFKQRDGKVVRWEIFPERAEALEAAGLRE
jgi:ketosteroid isomerase-like protein